MKPVEIPEKPMIRCTIALTRAGRPAAQQILNEAKLQLAFLTTLNLKGLDNGKRRLS